MQFVYIGLAVHIGKYSYSRLIVTIIESSKNGLTKKLVRKQKNGDPLCLKLFLFFYILGMYCTLHVLLNIMLLWIYMNILMPALMSKRCI